MKLVKIKISKYINDKQYYEPELILELNKKFWLQGDQFAIEILEVYDAKPDEKDNNKMSFLEKEQ